ncbi:MAG: IPTL-CTERM sorting domain-containing protein [Phycisphaerae bacterium]
MSARISTIGVVLGLAAVLRADVAVVVELVPDNPGPYLGGESLTVDVWLHSQVAFDVQVERLRFDFADSSPSLDLDPSFTFDLSSIPQDIGGYSFDPVLCTPFCSSPDLPLPEIRFFLPCGCLNSWIPLAGGGSLHIGSIDARLPNGGVHRLDLLNADSQLFGRGALMQVGVVPNQVPVFEWTAASGELTGGSFNFVLPPPKMVVELVPVEPGPYETAQELAVDVFLSSNMTVDVPLSLIRFDFSATHRDLVLDPTFAFDLSAIPGGDASGYVVRQDLPRPSVESTLSCECPERFLTVPAQGTIRIGQLALRLPQQAGTFTLDAAHATEPDENLGGLIERHGTPIESWRAFLGDLGGEALTFEVETAIPTLSQWGIAVMTLLLATAGAIIARRDRRSRVHYVGRVGNKPPAHSVGSSPSPQGNTFSSNGVRYLIGVCFALVAVDSARAQLRSEIAAVNIDSGIVSASGGGNQPVVVFSTVVSVVDVPWIRLLFAQVQLSGSPTKGDASFLRVTSQEDQNVQTLGILPLTRWGTRPLPSTGMPFFLSCWPSPTPAATKS